MKRLLPRPTYANVVATLALFVALGGAGYAAVAIPANSVGTKQLKDGAVTSAKVASHSLTGADIKSSTLGTVPNADQATAADTASHATSADTAGHAASADSAVTAQNAASLGGAPPASYRDSCPSGTQLRTAALCESKALESHVTYLEAITYCNELGLRVPTPTEAQALKSSIYGVWTDDFWTDEGKDFSLTYLEATNGLHATQTSEEANVDCVTTPTDN